MGRGGASIQPDRQFDWEAEPVPWDDSGLKRWERVVAFCEWLPVTKGIRAGENVKLLPHQLEFIERVYGDGGLRPVQLAVESIPRGNGKTGLLAPLALCHICGPEAERRGEIFGAAKDRNQAALLFNEIEAIIWEMPRLNACINIKRHEKAMEVLYGDFGLGSKYSTMTRDPRSGHGLSPSFWIYDELAQAPTGELLDNLITGMGKRNESLGIVISTQAPNDSHPLSELIDEPGEGKYVQLICAPADADPFDREVLRACNPALGHFLDEAELFRQQDKAARSQSFEPRFRNLRLNQRISAEVSFVSQAMWKANGLAPTKGKFREHLVFAGLDLSARHDLTALVWLCFDGDIWHVDSEFFAPEVGVEERSTRDRVPYDTWARQGHLTLTPGASVDYEFVADRLMRLCDECDVAAIAFDRWRIDVLKKEVDRLGVELPLQPFGQGFRDMAPALDALESELTNERMRHGHNPVLTWCAANAVVAADPAGNRKLDKAKSTGRIDGMVALAMAIGQAQRTDGDTYVSGELMAL